MLHKSTLFTFLAFVTTLVLADQPGASSVPRQQEYFLRLPFVHKLTSLPTPLEQRVSPTCEGTTFLLLDQRFRAFFFENAKTNDADKPTNPNNANWQTIARGGGFGLSSLVPAGYNPFGYKITELGEEFLGFEGSLDSDVGRFLSSIRTRKRFDAIKSQWLEILRVSKKGQSMRIYKSLQELIDFCLAAGFLN